MVDTKKRKVKVFLSGKDERRIVDEYGLGSSLGKLAKKYNVSKSYVSALLKRRNVKTVVNHSDVAEWKVIKNLDSLDGGICGVYGLYFVKDNTIKLYVESSTNIKNRLKNHYRLLNNGTHESKIVQKYFNDKTYQFNFAVIKKCDAKNIMQEERVYQGCYNKSCLLNSWRRLTSVVN